MSFRILNSPTSGNNAATYAEQARPDAGDIDALVAAIAGGGVVTGCQVAIATTTSLSVGPAASTVFSGGASIALPTATLYPAAANATNDRIDLIVATNQGATPTWHATLYTGTAAATPTWPSVLAGDIVLAALTVPAASTSLAASNLLDKRVFVEPYAEYLENLSAAPASPVSGQQYYDTGLQQVGIYIAGAWSYMDSLLTGAGAPSSSIGSPGDYYLDTANGILYGPKAPPSGNPPTFVAAAVTGNTSSLGIPSSIAVGDQMVAILANLNTYPGIPPGWTNLIQAQPAAAGLYYQVVTKTAAVGDAGSSFAVGGAYPSGSLVAYSGAGVPALITGTEANNATGTVTTGSSMLARPQSILGYGAYGDTSQVAIDCSFSVGTNRATTQGDNATASGFTEIAATGASQDTTFSITGNTTPNQIAAALLSLPPGGPPWPVAYNPEANTSSAQTTLAGTSAGSAISSQPFYGSSYKKFVVYLNGYENTTATAQTITFPTAFTEVPLLIQPATYGATPTSFGASVNLTTLTMPVSMAAAVTGWVLVEGY